MYDPAVFQKKYEAILCPGDPSKTNRYVQSAWIKYQIAYYMKPSRIVELGVRAGYSTWAMMAGHNDAEFVGYDSYAPGNQGKFGHEKEIRAHAEALYKRLGAELIVADTRTLSALPMAALYHVDACHNYDAAYHDTLLCLRANPGGVIVVHDFNTEEVNRGVTAAVHEYGKPMIWKHIDSHWGDVVLSREQTPWARVITAFDESLVKADA